MVRAAPGRKAHHDHHRRHVVPLHLGSTPSSVATAVAARAGVGATRGPPVLLIHGWSGTTCAGGTRSSALVEEFRSSLDLRGHGCPGVPRRQPVSGCGLWAADVAAVIGQLQLDRPTLVGWSYGGFVICDYLRAHGEGAVSAINFVGAAVTLNQQFDDIGPAFLSNAPAGADLDLPTRITALRRFWRSMSAEPLDPADFETGLCGSVSVPPQVLVPLICARSTRSGAGPGIPGSWSPTAARTRSSCRPWPSTSSRRARRHAHPGTTGGPRSVRRGPVTQQRAGRADPLRPRGTRHSPGIPVGTCSPSTSTVAAPEAEQVPDRQRRGAGRGRTRRRRGALGTDVRRGALVGAPGMAPGSV
jgi:pimeloyl-ACP methyl ester carboxylesterase